MAQERLESQEDQSILNSRIFKGGLVAAVVGALINAKELIAVGVLAVSAAWAWWKGRR